MLSLPFLATMVLALALAACTPPSATHSPTAPLAPDPASKPAETHHGRDGHPITAASWQLEHATDAHQQPDSRWQVPGRHMLELHFDADTVALSGLCNQMAASYTLDGAQIRFSQVTSTMRLCANDALMQAEHAVGLHLPRAQTWHMPTPQTLIITFDDDTTWTFHNRPGARPPQ